MNPCSVCSEHNNVSEILGRLDERQEVMLEELKTQRGMLERFLVIEERSNFHNDLIAGLSTKVDLLEKDFFIVREQNNFLYKAFGLVSAILSIIAMYLAIIYR